MPNHKHLSYFAVICLIATLAGCSDHPKLSPKAYDLSLAVYNSCKRNNTDGLAKVKSLAETALKEQQITAKESDVIHGIIAMAVEENQWKDAARLARELLDSQVEGR